MFFYYLKLKMNNKYIKMSGTTRLHNVIFEKKEKIKNRELTEHEKKLSQIEDSMNGYPFMDDLIIILKEIKLKKLDIDPLIKKDIKSFHDKMNKTLKYRKIEGCPYEVEIVREIDDCKKLWRKMTNEFIKIDKVKDFINVKEDIYEPLGERHVGVVRFFLNSDQNDSTVKKSINEIKNICNDAAPSASKYIYRAGYEVYCVYPECEVIDNSKFTDVITARIYEKYYRFKLLMENEGSKLAKELENIENEVTKLIENGKNRRDNPELFDKISARRKIIEDKQSSFVIWWNVGELERGQHYARALTPFSKSVSDIICGKEFMTNYNGFGIND